ncbi:MAG TPA: glucosidase [Polyangia bacterium]|jgi:hypothetical protein
MATTAERKRLDESAPGGNPWRTWGPYLSERQWGTVREDYSDSGDAWSYFPHEQARARAYRWGEDGLGGISDDKQRLCFALALWNGKDPILKERAFGLTNGEGNHGEDVKEYYFYLDNTPTHSYMKYLYKYPQAEYPYFDLVKVSRERNRGDFEYELLDTGIFAGNKYFDVFVEYAKAAPEDLCIKITVHNRGPEAAPLDVLPTLWFRNTWGEQADARRPSARRVDAGRGVAVIEASHPELGQRFLYCEGDAPLLFTENETNNERIFGKPNRTRYVKDGIDAYVVRRRKDTVNPAQTGTKAAPHYQLKVGAGESATIRLRLTTAAPNTVAKATSGGPFGASFEQVVQARVHDADEFYRSITPPSVQGDKAQVMRQALAGMLWSKQYYGYDLTKWLGEHGVDPISATSRVSRNQEWFHMVNDHVISMPDKWEYPWYAAWDLAFHTIALAPVDMAFAKGQIDLMLSELYLHPNGQVPAYEWNFSDVNPPVLAWASVFLTNLQRMYTGTTDRPFLERTFGKLLTNFTWWVNRKDSQGKGVFEGGFLGLDNIGVFDRSARLPTGGQLEQADGTAWMAFFCQGMLQIAAELATEDPTYETLAMKFIDHFYWIAASMNRMGEQGLWDEEDGFYYDVLRLPGGRAVPLKVRSMVGLLPLCATTIVEKRMRERVPNLVAHARWRAEHNPRVIQAMHATGPGHLGVADRGVLALVNEQRLRRILTRMLDEREFLSPYGIRSISRYHADHPYSYWVDSQEYKVSYLPAESDSGMFGGNSNWRGPIWMPVNALIVRGLLQYYLYYGDKFTIECPTGSGHRMNLFEVSKEIASRLTRIFLRDEHGKRPVYGGIEPFQKDEHWRDHILFYEYFHGDNGAGLGASHQTGWTGLVATLIQLFGTMDPQKFLAAGMT